VISWYLFLFSSEKLMEILDY